MNNSNILSIFPHNIVLKISYNFSFLNKHNLEIKTLHAELFNMKNLTPSLSKNNQFTFRIKN
jgi:hypothetical protein